jgi:hypothetical protein
MAEKILTQRMAKRIKESFLAAPAYKTDAEVDADIPVDGLTHRLDVAPYKMKDLYPDTYTTMTSAPDIDYSKLEYADGLFQGCAALQSVGDLDLSGAVSAAYLFDGCTALKSIGSLKVPRAYTLACAFRDCKALQTVPYIDTSHCRDFWGLFAGCTSLPETFPWTINMMAAENIHDRSCKLLFAYSSVKDATVVMDYHVELSRRPAVYQPGTVGNGDCNDVVVLIAQSKYQQYARNNGADGDTTATITIGLGNEKYADYTATLTAAVFSGIEVGTFYTEQAKYNLGCSFRPDLIDTIKGDVTTYPDAYRSYTGIAVDKVDTTAKTITFKRATYYIPNGIMHVDFGEV